MADRFADGHRPLQGLFDDWAGESFGWSMPMSSVGVAFGGPCACLGWIVSLIQVRGRRPANLMTAGSLPRGGTDRREADHREVGELEQRPGHLSWRRQPHAVAHNDLEPGGQFLQPWLVRHAHNRTGSSPGKISCSV